MNWQSHELSLRDIVVSAILFISLLPPSPSVLRTATSPSNPPQTTGRPGTPVRARQEKTTASPVNSPQRAGSLGTPLSGRWLSVTKSEGLSPIQCDEVIPHRFTFTRREQAPALHYLREGVLQSTSFASRDPPLHGLYFVDCFVGAGFHARPLNKSVA